MTENTDRVTELLCPTCKIDLLLSERQGIEIDYCPKCRGVWLDRGELDKIIERSAADDADRGRGGNTDYRQDGPFVGGDRHGGGRGGSGHGGGKHYGKRHGGFLGRLFD